MDILNEYTGKYEEELHGEGRNELFSSMKILKRNRCRKEKNKKLFKIRL